MGVEDVFATLGVSAHGLSEAEAARRLREHGPNRLPGAPPPRALLRLLRQFDNRLIYVLIAAALITALLGHLVDAAVIFGVVLVNALVGFVQEGRAAKALDAIRTLLAPRATVMREGRRVSVAADEVVPGDLVLIEPGDRAPADLRLVRHRSLRNQESVLTGESAPVEKAISPVAPGSVLGEQSSMAFAGTLIVAGQGAGIAVATGSSTEIGRISELVSSVQPLTTPLLRQMEEFAGRLTTVILAASAALFFYAVFAADYGFEDAFLIVVGVAVAAIPEGLPAVMTIALAIGVRRMAARNAIVRRLPAVETLGSVSVICSDKTGTLTRNEMMVAKAVTSSGAAFDISGSGYEPHGEVRREGSQIDPTHDAELLDLARATLLCNDAALRKRDLAWSAEGDPMEAALIAFAQKAGLESDSCRRNFPRTDEVPFDAQHQFMGSLHHGHDGSAFIIVKGSPERVLTMSAASLPPPSADVWLQRVHALAEDGHRVLALASKQATAGKRELLFSDFDHGFVLLGLVAIIDPPREEARAAIRDCLAAGIRVKMITGDHPATACAIARQLGLVGAAAALTGAQIETLDDETLRRAAVETDVFARTSPTHKVRLVHVLQDGGAVVAMTGDGVNDAPALKQANIGLAMGKSGTEAAKEASEIVLADDNFATIVAAVREGRTVYDNVQKVIAWTLPTNMGESLTIIAGILAGQTLPLTPVQILWINMVTAVTLGLTLAFEPPESTSMRRAPRSPDAPLLTGLLVWRIVFVACLFVAGAFGAFYWALSHGSLEQARTLVVNVIVIMEIFYLFNIRSQQTTSISWRGALGTPAVLIGIGVVVAFQLAFTYAPPLQSLFETRPIDLTQGLVAISIGVALFLIIEIEKFVSRRVADATFVGHDAS